MFQEQTFRCTGCGEKCGFSLSCGECRQCPDCCIRASHRITLSVSP